MVTKKFNNKTSSKIAKASPASDLNYFMKQEN